MHDPYLQGLYNKNMQIPWSCLCSISLPLSCCHPHFPKMGESDDQMLARSPQELCEPFIMAVWLVLALRFVLINPLCKAQEAQYSDSCSLKERCIHYAIGFPRILYSGRTSDKGFEKLGKSSLTSRVCCPHNWWFTNYQSQAALHDHNALGPFTFWMETIVY